MRRCSSILIVLALAVQCAYSENKTSHLTDRDKKQIIQTVLLQSELADPANPMLWDLTNSPTLYLLHKDLPSSFKPRIPKLNIILINPDQLQGKLKTNIDFHYFAIRKFALTNDLVVVEFGQYRGGNGYYSAHGATWEFRNVGKTWVGKTTLGWGEGS